MNKRTTSLQSAKFQSPISETNIMNMLLVITRDCPQKMSAVKRGYLMRIFCGQVLQMRTSALFWFKKLLIFQNLGCVRTERGDGE